MGQGERDGASVDVDGVALEQAPEPALEQAPAEAAGEGIIARAPNGNDGTSEPPMSPPATSGLPVHNRKRSARRKHGGDRKAQRQQQLRVAIAAWEAEVAGLPPRGYLPPLPYRPTDYAEAHALTAADRAALAADAVRGANVNAGKVLALVLSLIPLLDRLRPAFAHVAVDVALIDRIDTLVRAFAYADALASGALDPTSPDPWEPGSTRVLTPRQRLRSLFRRNIEARRGLNSDVRNLMVQGKVPAGALKNLKGGVGYYNTGKDVLTLVTVLRDAAPSVRAASSMSDAVLEQYTQLAYNLINLSSRISERSENTALAWDGRARAFTLLWNAHSQAQRALTHILWDVMDVKDVLPSLMVGVGRKKGGG